MGASGFTARWYAPGGAKVERVVERRVRAGAGQRRDPEREDAPREDDQRGLGVARRDAGGEDERDGGLDQADAARDGRDRDDRRRDDVGDGDRGGVEMDVERLGGEPQAGAVGHPPAGAERERGGGVVGAAPDGDHEQDRGREEAGGDAEDVDDEAPAARERRGDARDEERRPGEERHRRGRDDQDERGRDRQRALARDAAAAELPEGDAPAREMRAGHEGADRDGGGRDLEAERVLKLGQDAKERAREEVPPGLGGGRRDEQGDVGTAQRLHHARPVVGLGDLGDHDPEQHAACSSAHAQTECPTPTHVRDATWNVPASCNDLVNAWRLADLVS